MAQQGQSDPTQLNPMAQQGQLDPTQLNPLSPQGQSGPQTQYPPDAQTRHYPYDPQAPQYPYDPQAPQYPYDPQAQQYQQAPTQYPPPGGPFPPGPGHPYPPQYGPGGPGSGGGGGKVLAVIGSILVTLLVIGGVIGLRVYKNMSKNTDDDARGLGTTSMISPSSTPTTLPSTTVRPSPTSVTPVQPATVWIAATYNEATKEVHWARSSLSQELAAGQALASCGPGCQEPVWSNNGCVAMAFGQDDGWGSAWGGNVTEAQNKARATAENNWDVRGPFEYWSKCAEE
ncbi:DUF4189 domain-containing protein [Nocardia iowensis]|uniref:DUF4189 domain-containing protein n=1 Tax=Nocardia iowensis TaxID=204891 RepID=A0ABX8RX98_NOCIO|nr:DUF4189 domain-containing protein [Nocardia iowensis]QXN94284.1 DUF4189 domain-containing protein [Nocardia iowensis]